MSEPTYALFSGDYYYPCGGWDDYVDTFQTLGEAQKAHTKAEYTWAHVVSLDICEVVSSCGGSGLWT